MKLSIRIQKFPARIKVVAPFFCLLVGLGTSTPCSGAQITPFFTVNQSPVVQIFGLPPAERATLLPQNRLEGTIAVDMANNFAKGRSGSERIMLDGESYRMNLALRYGFTDRVEVGVDIPFVGHGRGIFDSFIEGWHDFFALPEGERTDAPRNRLLYSYSRGNDSRLLMDRSGFGVGDIRMTGAVQLYHDRPENPRALAVRAALKLPTGNVNRLHGSGSTDLSLWLTGSDDYRLSIGHATIYGAAGGMMMTRGEILRNQQKSVVGFGSFGAGWAPVDWIAFKMQLSGHTAFFSGSGLRELSSGALQLLIGGTAAMPGDSWLDIGVSEDIAVNTSPDIALHLALRRMF